MGTLHNLSTLVCKPTYETNLSLISTAEASRAVTLAPNRIPGLIRIGKALDCHASVLEHGSPKIGQWDVSLGPTVSVDQLWRSFRILQQFYTVHFW